MRRFTVSLICFAVVLLRLYAEPVDVSYGGFRIVLNDKTGSIGLYSESENAKSVPLLAPYDNFTGSYFSLMTDGSLYHLNRDSVSDMNARVSASGAEIQYDLSNDIRITVSFDPMLAGQNEIEYVLRIDVKVENLSDKSYETILRCLLDTYLGENTASHFFTSSAGEIACETVFSAPAVEQWIISAGKSRSLLLLLSGADVTEPEQIILGNKNIVAKWKPIVQPGRSFDSLQSFNNSAVTVYWPSVILNPGTHMQVRFYMMQGQNGIWPDVAAFTDSFASDSYLSSRESILALVDDRIDLEYLRDLLDRIQALEGSDVLDRSEALKLIAELDAILQRIKR